LVFIKKKLIYYNTNIHNKKKLGFNKGLLLILLTF